MISRVRGRLGPASLVVGVIAVVLACSGAAMAAKGGALTSKQKKEVEKIAKKFAGKDGAPGAQGPKGDTGAKGANGTNGTNGSNGATGATGATGLTGPTGVTGPTGQTGFTSTLPPEATETGTWRFDRITGREAFVAIGFPIPLTAEDAENTTVVSLSKNAPSNPNCPGTAGEPAAEPGFLCIYTAGYSTPGTGNPDFVYRLAAVEEEGISPTGALFFFEEPSNESSGSFAITAE